MRIKTNPSKTHSPHPSLLPRLRFIPNSLLAARENHMGVMVTSCCSTSSRISLKSLSQEFPLAGLPTLKFWGDLPSLESCLGMLRGPGVPLPLILLQLPGCPRIALFKHPSVQALGAPPSPCHPFQGRGSWPSLSSVFPHPSRLLGVLQLRYQPSPLSPLC